MGGFADYYGQTNLHPLALSATVLLAFLVLVISRRFALAPLLLAATTLPMAQRLVIAGADFTLLRLLLLAYLIRIIFRGEWRDFSWNKIDSAIILWAVTGTVIMTTHYGSVTAFVNRLGWSYDIILAYFAGRCLIRTVDDIKGLAIVSALISMPMAAFFLVEWMTRGNIFSVFGGVSPITNIREGRLRCQGPFPHPIMAGTFWAAMLPLIWVLLNERGLSRWLGYIGTCAALLIIAATASSTPILSVLVAFLGLGMFYFRDRRTQLWVGLLVIAVILHFFVMNNPIWHLMARVDFVGGSTGWHRYIIFDTFLDNFSEWYLTGNSNPQGWGVWQMRDITNQYILEGLRGGLATLFIFLLLIVRCFGAVGQALPRCRNGCERIVREKEWISWLIGLAILIHVVTFFGVSYFGQIIVLLHLQFAMAGCLLSVIASEEHEKKVLSAHG